MAIDVTSPALPPQVTADLEMCGGGDADALAIREVLNRVGDKWSLLVIGTLRGQQIRFTELRRRIPGVSQRMLTLTLRQLERDGLVVRTAHAEVPPRVEYALTDLGATLVDVAIGLASWATANYPEIQRSRERFDAGTS